MWEGDSDGEPTTYKEKEVQTDKGLQATISKSVEYENLVENPLLKAI